MTQADEVYLGHLVQGKTEKISYKFNQRRKKAKEEWVRAEYTHEPVISFSDFQIVQNLLSTNIRTSPKTKEQSLFSGLLFCADCKAQMTRRMLCSKTNKKIYYICSTKNKGKGCTRHSIEEMVLKEIIETILCRYFNDFSVRENPSVMAKNPDSPLNPAILCRQENRLKQEKEKYMQFCSKLYADINQGIITKEEFNHLQKKFTQKITYFCIAQNKQREFWNFVRLTENNIHEFSRLIKRIWIYEGKRIKIELWQNNSDNLSVN